MAEAYNASGSTAPIRMQGVKPWLIPNCDPTNGAPGDCAAGGRFVDNTTGAIQNNGSFVGQTITLIHVPPPPGTPPNVNTPIPGALNYYRVTVPIRPPEPICPSTSAVSCAQVGSDDYHDNVACSSTFQFSCGQTVGAGQTVTVGGGSAAHTDEGTQCLIHASNKGPNMGQDVLSELVPNVPPVIIGGGDNNPNPALQGLTNISRSDSIITVPIYQSLANVNLCPGGACTGTGTIVGFLQFGITQNPTGGNGRIQGVIMNVAGCNTGAGSPAVSGGGVSPVPVRLIHQ
jgi:hypothetical protein